MAGARKACRIVANDTNQFQVEIARWNSSHPFHIRMQNIWKELKKKSFLYFFSDRDAVVKNNYS